MQKWQTLNCAKCKRRIKTREVAFKLGFRRLCGKDARAIESLPLKERK